MKTDLGALLVPALAVALASFAVVVVSIALGGGMSRAKAQWLALSVLLIGLVLVTLMVTFLIQQPTLAPLIVVVLLAATVASAVLTLRQVGTLPATASVSGRVMSPSPWLMAAAITAVALLVLLAFRGLT